MATADLKLKRGQIKARLTRFKTFYNNFVEEKKTNYQELLVRLSKIEPIIDDFNEIQDQIETADPDNLDQDINYRTEFENDYFSIISGAQTIITKFRQAETPIPTSHQISNTQPDVVHQPINLPPLTIPKFKGNYEDWWSFSSIFRSVIDEHKNLSEIQKLYYLKTSLEGEAAKLLQSIELIPNNYKVAWSLLEERFKNDNLVIESQVKGLLDIPKLERESATSLRQLLDSCCRHIKVLETLKQPVNQCDFILVPLISSKFDSITYREWQTVVPRSTLPTMGDLKVFLTRRCQMLEALATGKSKPATVSTLPKRFTAHHISASSNSAPGNIQTCPLCHLPHPLNRCSKFLNLPITTRFAEIKKLNLCSNCLRSGHSSRHCKSLYSCRHCNKRHNSLLHYNSLVGNDHIQDTASSSSLPIQASESADVPNSTTLKSNSNNIPAQYVSNSAVLQHNCSAIRPNEILLATAVIDLMSPSGQTVTCRALLDPGSQISIITEKLVQQLSLKKYPSHLTILGVNSTSASSTSKTSATIKSRTSTFSATLDFVILSKITQFLPNKSINRSEINIPSNLKLADARFYEPAKIDMLLGAEIFFELLLPGKLKLPNGTLVFQDTHLGWIIAGGLSSPKSSTAMCNIAITNNLNKNLEKFWALEEVNTVKPSFTGEDKLAEQHFVDKARVTSAGRVMVSLPVKPSISKLGNSMPTAKQRFIQLEKRLARMPHIKQDYIKFMREYKNLGHMELVSESEMQTIKQPFYFIPHHAVIKESSSTTRLRVVFDASAKDPDSQLSLNDCLLTGPVIQDDLFSILTRFRKHRYAMTTDAEKMYRQVLIDPAQAQLQLIFWREDPKMPLQIFKLLTVTYGTACGSFLATRAIQFLADKHRDSYPIAADIATRDFYVDDGLFGAETLQEALTIQEEITELFKTGGFHLRKWCANDHRLLAHLDPSYVEQKATSFDPDNTVKTLGLIWNPTSDNFCYSINLKPLSDNAVITKRIILAEVASVFDILGLISPVILLAKLLIQDLWKSNYSWDKPVEDHLKNKWLQFRESLQTINKLHVPRRILINNPRNIQIHGFSDASQNGYGACIYLRSEDTFGNVNVHLICSKTRVAPVKQVSLPRLELCGALLLSELYQRLNSALNLKINQHYFYTDSTIILSWINAPSTNWNTFVSNRIAKIQTITKAHQWFHIKSQENPADLASRGYPANTLIESSLWWHGPHWLINSPTLWPTSEFILSSLNDLPEQRKTQTVVTTINIDNNFILKFSSLQKLIRVTGYCKRFIKNFIKHHATRTQFKQQRNNKTDTIRSPTIDELKESLDCLIVLEQRTHFSSELKSLRTSDHVKIDSKILALHPFVDEVGIIRVGGRLSRTNFTPDRKHPVILPKSSHLTKLIIIDEHERLMHSGPQAVLANLRLRYWPINGRSEVRRIIHKCNACFRARPTSLKQIMGDYPPCRVIPSHRAFVSTGVDYCGPFKIVPTHRRGVKSTNCFVAVFICMSVKAVHLELVSDLTSEAFIAALQRFMARRGKCSEIFSDSGTNFIGAHNELNKLYDLLQSNEHQQKLESFARSERIKWNFIPPRSPHMGGIWEAAVKSFKTIFITTVGTSLLTFEEFYTVMCRAESCLNSRPLCPMSNDPNDLSPLTPAHFLILDSLQTLPECNVLDVKVNRLTRWQHTRQLSQHFWKRWSLEVISEMQKRSKWKISCVNLKEGDLVLVKEDNLPPLQWQIGRVLDVHPGQDGYVRVATVKTTTGTYKRAVPKLCPFPASED